ncbi:gasdermin-E-like isoform X3 [Brachyhypopomus gauderio]|uniref:gasdermin-E-like isoform X3 n=1 Tax=Brachyhypopomus gauderio TaxID=698409 RepID=UPI004040FD7F
MIRLTLWGEMFDKVTQRLVCQIDPDGDLIAVSSLIDSEKLQPLAVVMNRPSRWFWQTTKYRPTGFTLNQLLQGEYIQPELDQKELVMYQKTHQGSVSGSLEAGGSALSVSVGGSGGSALSSSLGTLHEETVNVFKLIEDSKQRKVDFHHPLLKQMLDTFKQKWEFTVVTTRVFNTSESKIKYSSIMEGSSGITPQLVENIKTKVSGNVHSDTNCVMKIPANTVMAYNVSGLDIKSDGQYELEEVKSLLCVLDGLSHQSRSPLLLQLRQILLDREHLSVLEDRLEELVYDDAPSLYHSSCSHSPHQIIDTFLDLLIQSDTTSETSLSTESTNPGASMRLSKQNQSVLVAMYNLVSAAMGLTDDGLLLLADICSSQELKSLNDLVTLLTHHSQPLLLTHLPAPLQSEDLLRRVEQLFSSSNVVLKTEDGKLWAVIRRKFERLPFILCLVIHGLAYLSEKQQ